LVLSDLYRHRKKVACHEKGFVGGVHKLYVEMTAVIHYFLKV